MNRRATRSADEISWARPVFDAASSSAGARIKPWHPRQLEVQFDVPTLGIRGAVLRMRMGRNLLMFAPEVGVFWVRDDNVQAAQQGE